MQSISPHLKSIFGSKCLATKSSRSLLPSTYMTKHKATNLLNPKGYKRMSTSLLTQIQQLQKLAIQSRTYPSMSHKDHICYGISQSGTQFQNPCYNACITLLLQASPAHMHLVAIKSQILNISLLT